MKLWLLRHARPLVDSSVCYGALEVAADDEATQEAACRAAPQLAQALSVWHSPLQRCEQLAQVLQGLRPDLTLQPEPRLREMDFGCWEGVAWSDIPRPALDDWVADFGNHRFGGVESTNAVLDRVASAVQDFSDLLAAQGKDDGLWITHAGVVRALRLLGMGVQQVSHAGEWPVEGLDQGALTYVLL
jgi:alpha-ribazole phosphatase